MVSHKQANIKTGGKGKLTPGDKKQIAVLGRKGVDKERRGKGKSVLKIESDKSKDSVTLEHNEIAFLLNLRQRHSFDREHAMTLDELCLFRGITDGEEMITFYTDLKNKLSRVGRNWLREVEADIINIDSHIFLNGNQRENIIYELDYIRECKTIEKK